MTMQVNILEAKTQLSALIDRVLAGERVIIARAGRPVVDLVIHEGSRVTIGLADEAFRHDASVFDVVDSEINDLFYGRDA